MGSNTAEIDLTGFDNQIQAVEKHIFDLDKQLIAFTGDMSNLQKYTNELKLGKAVSELEKMLGMLRDKNVLPAFAKGMERAGSTVTQFIDSLARGVSSYKKILTENGGDSAIASFEKIVNKIKTYKSDMSNAFKGSEDGIRQTFKVIKSEFERLSNLQMPKNMDMKSIIKADDARKNIDAVRERIELLKMNLKDASSTFRGTGDNQLKQIVTDLGSQLKVANNELRNMKNEIKSVETSAKGAISPWSEYKQKMLEIMPVYSQIEAHIDKLAEVREMLKVNGKYSNDEDKKLGAFISKQINALNKMIKPYQEMVEFERTRRSEMEASIGVVKAEQQILDNRKKNEQELLNLKQKLASQETRGLTPLQRAEELDNMRIDLTKKLVNLQEQASKKTSSSALSPLSQQAEQLESKLKIVQDQLNALYAKYPAVQQSISSFSNPKIVNADGTINQLQGVQAEIVKIQNEYNLIKMNVGSVTDMIKNQISVLQQEEEVAKKASEAMVNKRLHYQEASLQRQANMWREALLRQKENAEWAEKHKKTTQQAVDTSKTALTYQQHMNNLLKEGNKAGINYYLNQEYSAKRVGDVIEILKEKQAQCNTLTREGAKRHAEIAQQIKNYEFLMGKNVKATERMKSAFGKVKNLASQIALSFGVMTGVFGATNFVKSLYKITSEFQLQQKALAAIVQNTREANILFKQMQALAVESPMKLMDLNKYAKQLAAFRIETNELYNSLKMLGDISVGVGVDMDRLILAYGQVKAANYLRGQELRQFSEAGVNILGGLRDYYRETKNINMSINEIFDSVSKRKVLFEDVDAVLKRMTQSGGEFYNMQLIQSQTLYGQTQKLADLFQIKMNEIGSSQSGTLLKFVTAAQLLIKNLRTIMTIIGTFAGLKMINWFIKGIKTSLIPNIKAISFSFKEARRYAEYFGQTKFTGIIYGLRNISLSAVAATGAIQALALVFALWMAKRQERISKEEAANKALVDEFVEYNRRLYDIKEIEERFKGTNLYKDRLVALQELVEKSKEYAIQLRTINEDITPENINEVFANASEELENYIKKVYDFKAALATPESDEWTEEWNKRNTEFAVASQNAEFLFKYYENNKDKLSKEQQSLLREIELVNKAIQENDTELLEQMGITTESWKQQFVERIHAINLFNAVYDEGGKVVTWKGETQQIANAERNIGSYLNNMSITYNKQLQQLKKDIEESAIDLSELIDPESKKLIDEKVYDFYNYLKDAFKDKPEFLKEQIPSFIEDILNADEGTVYTIKFKLEQVESNVLDPALQKFIDEVLTFDDKGNTEEGLTKNVTVRIKTVIDDGSGGYKDVTQTINTANRDVKVLSDASKTEIETLEGMVMSVATAAQKAVGGADERKKAAEEEYKRWVGIKEQIDLANKSLLDGAKLVEALNAQFGTHFYELKDFEAVANLALKNGQTFAEIMSWGELGKTKKGRTSDVTSQYRSMVDFIKKLNTEYEKLRKNFDKDESGGFMGAFDRIIESYKGEFGEMPKRFREAFGESIANIDFSTKEGSKQGEQIVKSIIEGAKDLTQKQKDELKRYVERAIGDITLDIDLKAKKESDERLNAQVQKMFDDYNLTVELKKLDINPDALGKMFNINTKDLATLQRQVESLAEQFTGEEQEKKYREYMRKIVEINDKANLEMAKNYSKYLREEFGERAKLELEYMRKRAEIYALPFDDEQQSRIIENLQKETQEKLDKLEWDEFRGSDYYVEMFEDLGRVSTQALQGMIDKLGEMRGKLSELSPTEYKTLVEQMQKITDELVRRNPFKALVTAIGEIKRVQGSDSEEGRLIRTWLGIKPDEKIRNFYKSFQQALNNIRLNLQQAESEGDLTEKLLGAARERDEAIKSLKSGGALADLSEIDFFNVEKLQEKEKDLKDEYDRLTNIINTGLGGIDPTKDMERRNAINSTLRILGSLISSLQTLGEEGKTSVSTSTLEQSLRVTKQKIAEYKGEADKLGDVYALIKEQQEAIKQLGEDWQDAMGKVKTTFGTVFDNLDYLGGTTDGVTEAWKELGDTIFDTVIQSIGLIAQFSAAAVAGETAINAAAGWIGLIAEAVTLIVTGISQIFKIKDAKIAKEMETIQKNMGKLKKTEEDLKGVFDNLFNEEELRAYDAAVIRTKELYIEQLEAMIRSEESKKKSDQAAIDGWHDKIESTYDEIKEQNEDFYNRVGGLGGQSEMKAQAEEWTNAWYEAFKETGDGLQGLEDSFDSFLDEIFKKQILNQLSSKYFKDLFEKLNTILGTGGGLQSNIDDFTEWVDDVHEQFGRFSEEAQQLAEIFYGAGGLGGGLEGLQASIQGMTEQTAELLAAYLNSIRFYVSDNSEQIAALTEALTVDNGTNPIIEQLKVIAQQTTSINLLLDSVVRPSGWTGTGSGAYIKVGYGPMPQ